MMDFSEYAGEIHCLGVFDKKGPERAMEIIVMTQAAMYQKALGVDYPEPSVLGWLKDETSSPISAQVPQLQPPSKTFSGKPPDNTAVVASYWALVCSRLQYDYDGASLAFCKCPYGSFARLHSRLCLYVYQRVGMIIGPRYKPSFESIMANMPWKNFWNRFMAEEQDKIRRDLCKPGVATESIDEMNKNATVTVLGKAKWDWQSVRLEVQDGFWSDKPGPIRRKEKCIEISDSLPRPSQVITAKSSVPAAAPKTP